MEPAAARSSSPSTGISRRARRSASGHRTQERGVRRSTLITVECAPPPSPHTPHDTRPRPPAADLEPAHSSQSGPSRLCREASRNPTWRATPSTLMVLVWSHPRRSARRANRQLPPRPHSSQLLHLRHVHGELGEAVGVAPFVVVPGDQLDKRGGEHDARARVENR